MKRILCIMMTVVLCIAVILPIGATETDSGTVEATESLVETESVSEAIEETESETVSDSETETESFEETDTETENIAAIIGNADNRLDAIVKIAGAMGITLDEAEALLDKMVALGDEHLAEYDLWNNIRADILENPDRWIIVALVVLMLIALVTFIIRGLIKNTTAQAATRANIVDIKKNEIEIAEKVNGNTKKLEEIEVEHAEIKAEIAEIRDIAVKMLEDVDVEKENIADILKMAMAMAASVDNIKTNSNSALKVNEEAALQTAQLLNIAMGRKLPNVSATTRKMWYEDTINKIKEAAGDTTEAEDGNEG